MTEPVQPSITRAHLQLLAQLGGWTLADGDADSLARSLDRMVAQLKRLLSYPVEHESPARKVPKPWT